MQRENATTTSELHTLGKKLTQTETKLNDSLRFNETMTIELQALKKTMEQTETKLSDAIQENDTSQKRLKKLMQNLSKSESKQENANIAHQILKQQFNQTETELSAAHLQRHHLNQVFFKDGQLFPVMQTNGQLIDFHQVLTVWTNKTDEDGHNPHRTYGCPVTSSYTSLCPFPILHQIQCLAKSQGMCIEPPVAFEREVNNEWIPMSMRTQIQLSARMCFLYANRERYSQSNEASITMTEDEQLIVTFSMAKTTVCLDPLLDSNIRH